MIEKSYLDPFEISYASWVEKMRDKLANGRMISHSHQKKVLRINRILKLYNILQKIKEI